MDEPIGLLVDDGGPEVTEVRPAPDPVEVPEPRSAAVPVRAAPTFPGLRPRDQRERLDVPVEAGGPEVAWCPRCAVDRSDHRRPLLSADGVAQFDLCASCLTMLVPRPSDDRGPADRW